MQHARGLETVADPQPLPRLAQVVDHGVVGQAELAADLLAVEVLEDQAKNLAFPIGKPIKPRFEVWLMPVHSEQT
jgi:hypothetical protein